MEHEKTYFMGIDVGVASLGVALVEYDREHHTGCILDGCARVYPASIGASERRLSASMRKQYARRKQRKKELRQRLCDLLQVPEEGYDTRARDEAYCGKRIDESGFSAIALRSRGISEQLAPLELARALYHIAHNRGSRLERSTTDASDEDKQESKATREAHRLMQQALRERKLETIGQYLHQRMQQGHSTKGKKGADGAYNFYITREDMRKELKRLLTEQQRYHPSLTKAAITELQGLIFYEHKDQDRLDLIGNCCYGIRNTNGDMEKRLAKGSSLFQEKRLLEEINNLRVRRLGKPRDDSGLLTLSERDAAYDYLQTRQEADAKQIKQAAGIDAGFDLSIEQSYKRKSGKATERKIAGNNIRIQLKNTPLEPIWLDLGADQCLAIEGILRDEKDFDQFCSRLRKQLPELDLSEDKLEELDDIQFESGYGAAGITATRQLIEQLRADVIDLKKAEQRAGLQHLAASHSEKRNYLPYYAEVIGHYCSKATGHPADPLEKRFGKIANPVVHRSLNQIRQVVNAYIKQYGKPQEIVVELSRDIGLSADERDRQDRENKKNQENNRKYDEIIISYARRASRKYRQALKLHGWQGGICPYTGETIAEGDIFNGNAQVDHVLPHSRTYDDSLSNLVLCLTAANQQKREQSPYEAFSAGAHFQIPGKGDISLNWDELLEHIKDYPDSKKYRFNADAMDKYQKENAFLQRYQGDTRYLGKVASQYLRVLFAAENHRKVRVLAGGITGAMRQAWGVHTVLEEVLQREQAAAAADPEQASPAADADSLSGKKRREDSRHHIVDAITLACISNAEIWRLHTRRRESQSTEEYYQSLRKDPAKILPWHDFRGAVRAFISDPKRVVQKRARDPMGQLHNDTSYAAIAWREKDGYWICSQRKDLLQITVGPQGKPPSLENMWKLLGFNSDGTYAAGLEKIAEELEAIHSGKVKGRLYWKSSDPRRDMESIIANLRQLGQAIESLYHQQPDTESRTLAKTRTKPEEEREVTLTPKEKLRKAVEQYQQRTQAAKGFNQYETGSLRTIADTIENDKPQRLYKPGANSHMEIYMSTSGKPGWEVIQRIDANQPGYLPRWRRQDADAELLFTLRKDEELEVWNDKDPKNPDRHRARIIVRVQKLSAADLVMFPVEKATSDNKSPHKIRDASIKRFLLRQPRLLVRDPRGKVLWRSPAHNW